MTPPLSCFYTSANAAEAEHDVWRKVHGQRPLLRNQLQCSFHSSTGKKTPLFFFFFISPMMIIVNNHVICRDWRSWTHKLQRRRWLKPTRNTFLTWPSSSRSRRSQRCDHPPPRLPPRGRLHQHCRNDVTAELSQPSFSFICRFIKMSISAGTLTSDVEIDLCMQQTSLQIDRIETASHWSENFRIRDRHNRPLVISQKYLLKFLQSRYNLTFCLPCRTVMRKNKN